MADQLNDIITQLERQRAAIDRALAALRDIDGAGATPSAPKSAAEAPADTSPRKPARRKVRFTPDGRRRLAEAMRRRWAAKRTAAQAKKRGRKAA